MRSRGLVVVLALILATLAVVGVFLYTKSVKENAVSGGSLTTVVVSKVDIPTNSDLTQLINNDQFEVKDVPTDDLVQGAITDVSQLRGRLNTSPILAGEQIPLARVEGSKVAGGNLGIPDGYEAMTVALEAPRAVAGAITIGDNVTIYATFGNVPVKGPRTTSTTGTTQKATESATVVLVPQVQILQVLVSSQGSGAPGTTTSSRQTSGTIGVTLAFLPEDAQKLVYALENGSVYLSLLPPNGKGVELPPLTIEKLIAGAKAGK